MLIHMYDLSFNAEVFHSFDYVCARHAHARFLSEMSRRLRRRQASSFNKLVYFAYRIVIVTVVILMIYDKTRYTYLNSRFFFPRDMIVDLQRVYYIILFYSIEILINQSQYIITEI